MTSDKKRKTAAILKLILLLTIIVGVPAFVYLHFGAEVFSKDAVNDVISFLKQERSAAFLMIIGLQVIQVVICFLPGQPIQFASSYMFGIGRGFLLSAAGAVLGTCVSFHLAKLLGSGALHLFFDEEKLKDYQDKLNSGRGLLLAFLVYLIPGIPKDLVAYAAGISEMRFRPFLIAATVGRSPGMLGSLLLGHFYGQNNYTAMAVIGTITAVLAVVFIVKREAVIEFLDKIEMKDVEREEKANG